MTVTLAHLEHAFAAPFSAESVARRGDADLNPGMKPDASTGLEQLTAAAVLVPILKRTDGDTVLFTVRHKMLRQHAGQISFPGGRVDPEDVDVIATALRETEEEVGVPQEAVRVLGTLDCYVTRTGYCVTPVVGVIEDPPLLGAANDEVEDVFEVPLGFVLDPNNVAREFRDSGGQRRSFYAIRFDRRYIWGATAGMLVSLGEFVRRCRIAL